MSEVPLSLGPTGRQRTKGLQGYLAHKKTHAPRALQ